jgi:hypothetical protein
MPRWPARLALTALDRPGNHRVSAVRADYNACQFFDFGAAAVVTTDAPDPAIGPSEPGQGGGFEQCYNAQAVVAAESLLVIAVDVVQAPNDLAAGAIARKHVHEHEIGWQDYERSDSIKSATASGCSASAIHAAR